MSKGIEKEKSQSEIENAKWEIKYHQDRIDERNRQNTRDEMNVLKNKLLIEELQNRELIKKQAEGFFNKILKSLR